MHDLVELAVQYKERIGRRQAIADPTREPKHMPFFSKTEMSLEARGHS